MSHFPPPTGYPPPAPGPGAPGYGGPGYGVPSWGRVERPTDVFGRRIGAFFIDLVPLVIALIVMFGNFAEAIDQPSQRAADSFCDRINSLDSDLVCIPTEDAAFLLTGGEILAMVAVFGGYFLVNYVVLTGLTGASIGKAMVGIRCVKASTGERCGIPRAFLRTLLFLIPDGICAGLVGLLVGALTDGHRRVGDFAAGTAVVGTRWVNHPALQPQSIAPYSPYGPVAGGYPPPVPGYPPGQYPPPGQYAPPGQYTPTGQYAPPAQWVPPPPGQYAPPGHYTPPGQYAPPDPAAPPAGSWSIPTPASPPSAPTPVSPSLDETSVFEPLSITGEPTTVTPAVDTPAQGTPTTGEPEAGVGAPMWDEARNTYIQWDPDISAWMQWDEAESRWKPIDS